VKPVRKNPRANVARDELADPERAYARIEGAVVAGILPDTEANRINALALTRCALAKSRPGGFWTSSIRKGDFRGVTNEHHDWAANWHRDRRRARQGLQRPRQRPHSDDASQPEGPVTGAEAVAGVLAAMGITGPAGSSQPKSVA
jgi:hypothetical protein